MNRWAIKVPLTCRGAIADRVLALRKERGLSPGELAGKANIGLTTLARLEMRNGPGQNGEVTLPTLSAVASALGTNLHTITAGVFDPVAIAETLSKTGARVKMETHNTLNGAVSTNRTARHHKTQYKPEFRKAMVLEYLQKPEPKGVGSFAASKGIPLATFSTWLKKRRGYGKKVIRKNPEMSFHAKPEPANLGLREEVKIQGETLVKVLSIVEQILARL